MQPRLPVQRGAVAAAALESLHFAGVRATVAASITAISEIGHERSHAPV
jgi:hypothetical protein